MITVAHKWAPYCRQYIPINYDRKKRLYMVMNAKMFNRVFKNLKNAFRAVELWDIRQAQHELYEVKG